MRFVGCHTTRFRYSEAVYLEPHAIRLRPRCDSSQRLDSFHLALDPEPSMLAESTDAEGNVIAHAWFAGFSKSLTIRSEFEAETLGENPFDFLLEGEGTSRLPLRYFPETEPALAASLEPIEPGATQVAEYARKIAQRSHSQTLPFLTCLCEDLCNDHEVAVRERGEPMLPSETLRADKVSCRDLAVLFLACCRTVGIATRFVSGYQEHDSRSGEGQMHAWAEVYLPGGGWRGYDPTQGLAVSDRHVAVAASSVPRLAAPTSGSFRGAATAEPLEAEIRIETFAHPTR